MDSVASSIVSNALSSNQAIGLLKELAVGIGSRISGSPQYEKAVQWSEQTMVRLGFDNVRLQPATIPHWVRGSKEEAWIVDGRGKKLKSLAVCALGGSVGTPNTGLTAEVIEVHSIAELKTLGDKAKGKIVFFNRPMDRTLINTFQAYGGAVDQRGQGAIEAARAGGVAALVRSMSTSLNDFPHTGAMRYDDSIPHVPAIAISTNDAELLSAQLKEHGSARVSVSLSCETLPDVVSANVLGELRGTEHPEEVVVIGGHLDSWDKGQGAHDDGAGCVQSIDALRILKDLGLRPKRTIRAVMFANEENGLRGGRAYADSLHTSEKHIAAIESDEGGFAPRGFSVADSVVLMKLKAWQHYFSAIDADRMTWGGGGSDIIPLQRKGVPSIGLNVETHRYFEYHHSDNDTFDKVNERELALGSAALAILAYLIAEEGL